MRRFDAEKKAFPVKAEPGLAYFYVFINKKNTVIIMIRFLIRKKQIPNVSHSGITKLQIEFVFPFFHLKG